MPPITRTVPIGSKAAERALRHVVLPDWRRSHSALRGSGKSSYPLDPPSDSVARDHSGPCGTNAPELWNTRDVSEVVIVDVSRDRLDELEPLWRSLHEHHNEVTPHLHDRARPFEEAWKSRRRAERTWLEREPETFVVAAQRGARMVGYAFVRIRSGAGFAESWNFSDPLADLVTLAVLPECRGQGIGSCLMDAVEARLRALGVADLEVVVIATNAAVIPFYQRRGAVPFITQFVQPVQSEPGRSP